MPPDEDVRIARESAPTGGGGGYRFNTYGRGRQRRQPKKETPADGVSVELSAEAEEQLAEHDDDQQNDSPAKE